MGNATTTSGSRYLFDLSKTGGAGQRYVMTTEVYLRFNAGNTNFGNVMDTNHAIFATRTPATAIYDDPVLFKNSTTAIPGSPTNPTNPIQTGAGGYRIGWGGSSGFGGDIAEILVYEKELTTDEINQVGYYLQEKYGIAASFTAPAKRIFDDGGSGSDWGTADNWDPDNEPTALNDAFVGGGFTATVTAAGEVANNLTVGHTETSHSGVGTLNVTGGSLTTTSGLTLGDGSNKGTVNLSGGTLTVNGGVAMGHGSSLLNITGGAMQVTGGISGNTGTVRINADEPLDLIGSTVDVTNFQVGYHGDGKFTLDSDDAIDASRLTVGEYSGTGQFVQDGGTVTVGSNAVIGGNDATGVGTYTINNNGTLTVGSQLNIGNQGTGTFNLESGDVDVGSYIRTSASNATGWGVINVSGGTLNGSADIRIGEHNSATGGDGIDQLNVSAGTVTTPANLVFGISGGKGQLNLSGSGVVNVNNITQGSGTGTVNINGGTLNVGGTTITVNEFKVGPSGGKSGSFTLNTGQTLTGNRVTVGDYGTGHFVQKDGSTVNVPGTGSSKNLIVGGNGSGGNGTYTMEGGTLTVAADLNIGNISTGLFDQQDGNVTVNGKIQLAAGGAGNGDATYLMKGGVLNANNAVRLGVTNNGSGVFTQTNGTVTVGTNIELAVAATSTGTYNLKGGVLDLTGGNVVFGPGNVTFNFTGGELKDVVAFGSSLTQTNADSQSILAPGASTGTTTIDGNYQFDSGIYAAEIDGPADGDNDVIAVLGSAYLNGSIDIALLDGHVPAIDEVHNVITADLGITLGPQFALDQPDGMLSSTSFDYRLTDSNTTLQLFVGRPRAQRGASAGPRRARLVGLGSLGQVTNGLETANTVKPRLPQRLFPSTR